MTSPISIPSSSRSRWTSSEDGLSSSLSPGLYVPLHRRRRGGSPTPSSSSFQSAESASGSSPLYSSVSSNWPPLEHVFETRRSTPGVYSRDDLMRLAHSPLAKLAPEVKAAMRDIVPDIVLSRRKAETKRWRVRQEEEHQPRRRELSSQRRGSERRGSWSSDEWQWQS